MSCLSVGEPEVWRVHVWSFPRLGFILSLISGTSNSSGGYLHSAVGSSASYCQLHAWLRRPRYRYAVRSGDDNPMLRTGDRSVPTLTTLTTFGYGSKMIKRSKTWNCLISTSTAVNGCSSPKHLFFYDGLHACRCRCRWSLCTAKGAIPCAASSRVPGCGWVFCQSTHGHHGPTTAPSHSKLWNNLGMYQNQACYIWGYEHPFTSYLGFTRVPRFWLIPIYETNMP